MCEDLHKRVGGGCSSKWERDEYARRDVDSSLIQEDRLIITDETTVS